MKSAVSKRVSQREVAEAAHVSRALVSAVLSETPSSIRFSKTVRQRVFETAERLGYRRRFMPLNSLGHPKTRMVVWIEFPRRAEEDWLGSSYAAFYQRLMNSVVEALAEHRLTLIVKHHQENDDLIHWLAEAAVEGIIWRCDEYAMPLLQWVARRFPVVSVNRLLEGVDSVRISPSESLRLAIQHLYENGHRRIAYFGRHGELHSLQQAAYEAFVARHSLERYPEFSEISDDPSRAASSKAKEIFETWERLEERRPTALITADVFALHVLKEALERGITIPNDLSVVGIDNVTACEISHPSLTSIPQPLEEMGRAAMELLLGRMAAPTRPIRTIEINPREVVKRHSVAAPGSHPIPIIEKTSSVPSIRLGNI